jgi:Icc protein
MSSIQEEDLQRIDVTKPDRVNLVQITDCHIFDSADKKLMGLNTRRSFEAVKAAIAGTGEHHDLLLATGDLSQDGSAASYRYLAQQFDDLGIPTFWLPGNHDEPELMPRHFTGDSVHAAKRVLAGAWQVVLLDSSIAGEVHGRVSDTELTFMDNALRQYPDRHALICLHHQAIETGSEWIDMKGLLDAEQLRSRMAQHGNIRAVIWGHVHQESHKSVAGVEWMSTPSSCVQFEPGSRDFATSDESPGYPAVSDGRELPRAPGNLSAALAVFEQRLEDRAAGGTLARAVTKRRYLAQSPLYLLQITNFLLNVLDMRLGQRFHVGSRVAPVIIGQLEQSLDPVAGESEGPGALDEIQPAQMFLVIRTIAGGRTFGCRHQTDGLVITNRFDVTTGFGCQFSTGQHFSLHLRQV